MHECEACRRVGAWASSAAVQLAQGQGASARLIVAMAVGDTLPLQSTTRLVDRRSSHPHAVHCGRMPAHHVPRFAR